MREIKFRAWSKEHNEMWGVAYLSWVIDIAYDEPERNISSDVQMFGATNGKPVSKVGYNPAKNIVLMQFTGLKDKNDMEIYEGDIVADGYHEKYGRYAVQWDAGGARWGLNSADGRELEVIGNIYENPSLLQE